MLYGFPPGVGATGTAALLNVPQSLEQLLAALQVRKHAMGTERLLLHMAGSGAGWLIIIIIIPCKPYLSASAPRLTLWGGGK
jgi:cobalamin biosynthesis Mg chelatase CobN